MGKQVRDFIFWFPPVRWIGVIASVIASVIAGIWRPGGDAPSGRDSSDVQQMTGEGTYSVLSVDNYDVVEVKKNHVVFQIFLNLWNLIVSAVIYLIHLFSFIWMACKCKKKLLKVEEETSLRFGAKTKEKQEMDKKSRKKNKKKKTEKDKITEFKDKNFMNFHEVDAIESTLNELSARLAEPKPDKSTVEPLVKFFIESNDEKTTTKVPSCDKYKEEPVNADGDITSAIDFVFSSFHNQILNGVTTLKELRSCISTFKNATFMELDRITVCEVKKNVESQWNSIADVFAMMDDLDSHQSIAIQVKEASAYNIPEHKCLYKLRVRIKSTPKKHRSRAVNRLSLQSDSGEEEPLTFHFNIYPCTDLYVPRADSKNAAKRTAEPVSAFSLSPPSFKIGKNTRSSHNTVAPENEDSEFRCAPKIVEHLQHIQSTKNYVFLGNVDVSYNTNGSLVFLSSSEVAEMASICSAVSSSSMKTSEQADIAETKPTGALVFSCDPIPLVKVLDDKMKTWEKKSFEHATRVKLSLTHNADIPPSLVVQEESNVSDDSCITGLPDSILDAYREVSICCLRHMDIPGVKIQRLSNTTICSSLKGCWTKSDFAYKNFMHFEKVKPKKNNSSDTRELPGLSPEPISLSSGKKTAQSGSSVSFTSLLKEYECDIMFAQAVKDAFMVPEYTRVQEIAAKEKVFELSNTVKNIPIFFVSGLSLLKLLKYKEAKEEFLICDQICCVFQKLGDSALCNLYLGDIMFLSGKFTDAYKYYKTAIKKYRPNTVASCFCMVPPSLSTIHAKCGSALRNESKMVDAVQQYKLAIKEAKTDKESLAANTSLGNLYQSLGENITALTHYEQSVKLSEKLCDHVSLGWAHGNIGNAYLGLFQKDKALFHLQKSLDLTLLYECTPSAIGRAHNNLGTAYQSVGDLDKAQEHYEYARSQAVKGNDQAGQARVRGNMGNVLMLRKDYLQAIEQYTEVLTLSKDHSTLSTAHHNRGCAYYEWAELKMTTLHSSETVEQGSITFGTKQNVTRYYIHGLNFEEFKPRVVTEEISPLFRKGCEDLKKVVKFHEDHLHNIKGSSKGLTLSVSLFETNSRTFHRLQDCSVSLGEYTSALLVAEQSRARTLGELLLTRKRSYLQPQVCSPMPFDQIVSTVMYSEHPILYLSYTGARLLGWVFVSDQSNVKFSMFEVLLKDDQFDGKSFDHYLRYSLTEILVERSYEMYHEANAYDEYTSAPVQTLYELIARPLLTILKKYGSENATKLIVISDSYTALLPLSSLHDSKTNTFLGDQFSFQLMPSFLTMSILNQLADENVVNLPVDTINLCIVGNPSIPQFMYKSDNWNLGKLPHAKLEAESVARILKTTPILEHQATKEAILMRIRNAKVIHLATHGSASEGFLAFGTLAPYTRDEAISAQGVLLLPREVEELNINPALVVLSSCDSARGAVKADGIQGMARAFILAGAQAVLTTLWRIPDESASVFMQFFYQYMMDGLESTKALQKAILSIRCFSKYSQYIHWSGYQLTGRDIYLKYTKPQETQMLEKRLGKSNIFPRLEVIKLLESNLVEATCYPTDVQILKGCPGLDGKEVVIDFIHNSYKHFTGGIFWISCQRPEFVDASIEYIEKYLRIPLEGLQVSEIHPCLFVLDAISELPVSKSLLRLLKNRRTHCIMLYHNYLPEDKLIHAVDYKLVRGCKVHDLEPLSMIHATQRIVYAIQKEVHFAPNCSDHVILGKISDFTSGSPILENILSIILPSYISNASKSPHEALKEFSDLISLDLTREKRSSSLLSSSDSYPSSSSSASSFERQISSDVCDCLPSLSKLNPDYRDEWDTQCVYDSWDSIAELLNACHFDCEEKLLLYSLSSMGYGPIPISMVVYLSRRIAESSGKTHLTGSLLNNLMDKGLVKLYPPPVVIHSNFFHKMDTEFVCVPKYISDCLLRVLQCNDKIAALSLFHRAPKGLPSKCQYCHGLLKLLIETFEVNSELVGEKCYEEMLKQCFSQLY